MGDLRFTKAKSLSQVQWGSKLPELELENGNDFLRAHVLPINQSPSSLKILSYSRIDMHISWSHNISYGSSAYWHHKA